MAVDSVHPQYSSFKEEWDLVRAALRGESAVTKAGETYLPKAICVCHSTLPDEAEEAVRPTVVAHLR